MLGVKETGSSLFVTNVTAGSGVLDFGTGLIGNYTVTGIDNKCRFSSFQPDSLVVPATFTIIGNSAFLGCAKLKDLRVAQGANLKAYYGAFGESGLTNIHFCSTASGTVFETYVFGKCSSLRTVYLDTPNMTSYPAQMFKSGKEISSFVCTAKNITSVGKEAFRECSKLTCDISSILPESVETIGDYAFYLSPVGGDLYLPHLEKLGQQVFMGATNMTSIALDFGDNLPTNDMNRCFTQGANNPSALTSLIIRCSSPAFTSLCTNSWYLFAAEKPELQYVELDIPALRYIDPNPDASTMFLAVNGQDGNTRIDSAQKQFVITASNLVSIGNGFWGNQYASGKSLRSGWTNIVFHGSAPSATTVSNLFVDTRNKLQSYDCVLRVPKYASFGWRAFATPLTSEEEAMEEKPEGAFGTYLIPNKRKVWMAHFDSPYYRTWPTVILIR